MVDYLGCLDKALVETLKNKSLTITTAESCTGGMVASAIVNISGASDIFKEAILHIVMRRRNVFLELSMRLLRSIKL